MARPSGHKIGAGTLNIAGVDALTAITAWTPQTDQGLIIPWSAPSYDLSTLPDQIIEDYLSGSSRKHGYLNWRWVFPHWTSDMYVYWMTNIMSNAVSASVSVLTYNKAETGIYIAAIAKEPEVTPTTGVAFSAVVEFDYGELITS